MKNLFVIVLTVLGPLIFFVSPVQSESRFLSVYVSILPQKYFVERIGGDLVAVSVMVGPGESPATYEPTPRQMDRLAKARLYFSIGVPFEKIWMKRLQANFPTLQIIDTLQGVALLPMSVHRHNSPKEEDDGHQSNGGGKREGILDPHVWTSPPRVKIMAKNILEALVTELPAHQEELTANYEAFLKEMDQLTDEIQRKLDPVRNRRFLVFHPSWGYFADTFKLEQIAIESEGKEPGARTLAHLIQVAREQNIRVIFVQKQFSSVAARMVAEAIKGQVEAVDPLAENYSDNLRRVGEVFAEAMTP